MSNIQSQPSSLSPQKQLAVNITRVLSIYGFLTDSYIIEFFTDNLWDMLPESWRSALSDLPSPQLANLLLSNTHTKDVSYRSVWPLSLLALKACAHSMAFPRTPHHENGSTNQKRPEEFLENHCQSSLLDPLFRKHVKPKKQHEIRQLGTLVKKLSDVTGCDLVVDIGSGQGHLSRFLSFGQGLSVTAVEADKNLVTMAAKFDQHLMYMLQKDRERSLSSDASMISSIVSPKPPTHVLAFVDPRASWEDLLKQLGGNRSMDECKAGHLSAPHLGSSLSKDNCQCHRINTRNSEDNLQESEAENQIKRDTSNSHFTDQDNPAQSVLDNGINSPLTPGSCSQHSVTQETCFCHATKPLRQCPISPVNKILLTGLHACGDLSVAMLRHFARCPSVVGITSVACCYMKLTTSEMPHPPGILCPSHSTETMQQAEYGYPMSSWVSQLPGHKLSYKAREVACHAIEDYTERLKAESNILRTHCYRAVLETIIRSKDPTMKRAGVQTIKKAHELPFKEYARQGLKRVGLDPDTPLNEVLVEQLLSQQQNVVAFFSLALLLAPLVETLILLDRMIFLQEEASVLTQESGACSYKIKCSFS
ncbi:methyltransferase-like protein 25B isoform 2-T3 [Rhinophrynus dorsalis]